MSDRFQISKGERGVIRLFSVDTSAELPIMSAEPQQGDDPSDPPWPLRDALGAAHLDQDFIELFDVADLQGVGLSGYLTQGLGVAEADIAPDRARLDALKGHILIVLSQAVANFDQTLQPRAPLRWVGTYLEDRPEVSFDPLPDKSARSEAPSDPEPKPKPPSDAAISGRVAVVALLVAFGIVAMMVWIGG